VVVVVVAAFEQRPKFLNKDSQANSPAKKGASTIKNNQGQSKWHFENYDVVEKLFVACWLPI